IRRRRPSPEDDGGPHQLMLRENGLLKGKPVHMPSYQPPSLKAVQRIAQAHLSSIDMTSMDKEDNSSEEEEGEENGRVRQTSTDHKERRPSGDLSSDSVTRSCDLSSHPATEDDAEDSKEEEGE
ncbi:protein phosphatase 1 regulatory subunit 1B-like, partial [Neosynchiropus ocellatus]